jgi:hypothetical protein
VAHFCNSIRNPETYEKFLRCGWPAPARVGRLRSRPCARRTMQISGLLFTMLDVDSVKCVAALPASPPRVTLACLPGRRPMYRTQRRGLQLLKIQRNPNQ